MDAAFSARLSSLFPLGAGRTYQTPLWASPVPRGFSIPQRFVTAPWLWDKSSTVWECVTCRALSIAHLSLQPPLPEARVVTQHFSSRIISFSLPGWGEHLQHVWVQGAVRSQEHL